MRPVTVRLSRELVEKLDEVARKTLSSRSEIVRSALVMYFSLLENVGFYFKPSPLIRNVDVYVERNAVNLDLGNLSSISVISLSYGGVGEAELDKRRELTLVAEVMASQLFVEAICRFVEPLVVAVSTANDLSYSLRFLKLFRDAFLKRANASIILASCEETFETRQSALFCTLVGMRDMSVRNQPRRGDAIYLWGKVVKSEELKPEDLPDAGKVRNLANLVRSGEATAVFPVKSAGVEEVANFAASIAGGRAKLRASYGGCPATAIVLTSAKDLTAYGCEEIGEII